MYEKYILDAEQVQKERRILIITIFKYFKLYRLCLKCFKLLCHFILFVYNILKNSEKDIIIIIIIIINCRHDVINSVVKLCKDGRGMKTMPRVTTTGPVWTIFHKNAQNKDRRQGMIEWKEGEDRPHIATVGWWFWHTIGLH